MKNLKIFVSLTLLCAAWATVACAKQPAKEPAAPAVSGPSDLFADSMQYSPKNQAYVLNDVARKYFDFFWTGCNPDSKMALRGTERGQTVSLAGSAYGISGLPVAVERGWITRKEGIQRWLDACRFFDGKAERYHGAWSHWIDGKTGEGMRFSATQNDAGDLVESAFLLMGMLVCSEYFTGTSAEEIEARAALERMWAAIDWKFWTNGGDALNWAWDKDLGFTNLKLIGPNESLPTYILGLAAPEATAITPDNYNNGWIGKRYSYPGRTTYGYKFELGRMEKGQPLFATQHPYMWFDASKMKDQYADYWEFTTNHPMIVRHYCVYEAPKEFCYDEQTWGLSATYAPAEIGGYTGRSPENDAGIIATCASIGAMSAIPYYAFQAILGLRSRPALQGKYGVTDDFIPATTHVDGRYLAISVLPLVSIIENYRTGLVWKLAMQNERVKTGLRLAGYVEPTYPEGFCQMTVNTVTKRADLIANPDTEKYNIKYYLSAPAQRVTLEAVDASGKVCHTQALGGKPKGVNVATIDYAAVAKRPYTLCLQIDSRTNATIDVNLR